MDKGLQLGGALHHGLVSDLNVGVVFVSLNGLLHRHQFVLVGEIAQLLRHILGLKCVDSEDVPLFI